MFNNIFTKYGTWESRGNRKFIYKTEARTALVFTQALFSGYVNKETTFFMVSFMKAVPLKNFTSLCLCNAINRVIYFPIFWEIPIK